MLGFVERRACMTFSKMKYYQCFFRRSLETESKANALQNFKSNISSGPGLSDFINSTQNEINTTYNVPPYLTPDNLEKPRKVYVEIYGCQMNVNDTEIVYSIFKKAGYEIAKTIEETDILFLMTCAIREGAEQKIWNKLKSLRYLKKKKHNTSSYPLKVGVLGCMAERLKHKFLEKEKLVDIVAGPDSYKDLPNLLSLADTGENAINVMLSADETYADIMPVRIDPSSKSAFVSIMRGCDNMCSFCIVPFTRGRERSRPISSIVDEIKYLSEQGVKEVTLLGQNVNSYRDTSASSADNSHTILSSGFHTVYKTRIGGLRFADLLYQVADVNPEMRIRFTSPHPKDFADDVLHVVNEKPNICKLLHMPAQSGNNEILGKMMRGYTREAYLELIDHIRKIIPDVAFSSDFICGFCGETEEQHHDTISLIQSVKYEYAYIFPYSMREKTRAHRTLLDIIPENIKKKRAEEVHTIFRKCALQLHQHQIGKIHLIQVIGVIYACSRKSTFFYFIF